MKTKAIFHPCHPLGSSRYVKAVRKLPELEGRAVRIRFVPALSAGSRKLYSNRELGQPVFAATFIRKREIVLDDELLRRPKELARIFTHELFHFVWVRLGNPARRAYETMLRREWKQKARGELGWSAESRKLNWRQPPRIGRRHLKWREYVCESFCDTAAWFYSGIRRHDEFTLAKRHRKHRADWFRDTFGSGAISI